MSRYSIQIVRNNLRSLLSGNDVPYSIAHRLVAASAYWYGHPNGPAHAPKHANRITRGCYGWEVSFGANALLIENAIRRCVTVIEAALLEADEFYDLDESEVAEKIALALRGSVANYAGVEYAGYYDANDGYMHFGVQAIHVDSFVSEVWDVLDLDLVNRPEDYDWFEQDDV